MPHLQKWYGDCVTDAGDVVIAYRAVFFAGALRIPYSALYYRPVGGPLVLRTCLGQGPTPHWRDGSLVWPVLRGKGHAQWSKALDGFGEVLYEQGGTRIEWRCEVPSGMAQVSLPNGAVLTGTGYVEHLTLDLPGFQLPFDELRWGRFTNPKASVVWIDWRGQTQFSRTYCNGVPCGDAELREDAVLLPSHAGTLSVNGRATIVSGTLWSVAFPQLTWFERFLPRSMVAGEESKYCSRSSLTVQEQRFDGWVIDERVTW